MQCPFFRCQDRDSVGCEAPFDGATLRMCFAEREDKEKQVSVFCEDLYKRCEIYRCVMANKYPENE